MDKLKEIEKALGEFSEGEDLSHFYAHAPEWLRLLVERVRKLEAFAKSVTDENSTCGTHESASDMLCELATEADRLLKIKREVVSI